MEKYFNNLLGNSRKVTDKPITKIINNQQDIKLEQFTHEELNLVLTKITNRKAASLDEMTKEDKKIWRLTASILHRPI